MKPPSALAPTAVLAGIGLKSPHVAGLLAGEAEVDFLGARHRSGAAAPRDLTRGAPRAAPYCQFTITLPAPLAGVVLGAAASCYGAKRGGPIASTRGATNLTS